jgi:autotransporter adhesin
LLQNDTAAAHDDTAVAHDDTAVAHDDNAVAHDDNAVAYNDNAVAHNDTAVAYNDTAVAHDDTAVAHNLLLLKLNTKVMFSSLSVGISVDVFLASNDASLTSSWNVMSSKCVKTPALPLISKQYGSVARCSDTRTRCFASL